MDSDVGDGNVGEGHGNILSSASSGTPTNSKVSLATTLLRVGVVSLEGVSLAPLGHVPARVAIVNEWESVSHVSHRAPNNWPGSVLWPIQEWCF